MELRTASSPKDEKYYDTKRLRDEFVVEKIFFEDEIKLVYSHIDRIIFGGAMPVSKTLRLEAGAELRAKYFCERRELGIINIGGSGVVTADGVEYRIGERDGMYIGMGTKEISFASDDAAHPAKFYMASGPAHKAYPTKRILKDAKAENNADVEILAANKKELGTLEDSNHRTICKYILERDPDADRTAIEAAQKDLEREAVLRQDAERAFDERKEAEKEAQNSESVK